jgi:glycosyltransferase involved in cell wall biosynthesis
MRIYPLYSRNLQKALEALNGNRVTVVTTNCGCFDKSNPVNEDYEFVNLPYYEFMHPINLDRSNSVKRIKHHVKTEIYAATEYLRGRALSARSNNFDVVNFQQSSYAFGYESLVSFLSSRSKAKKVITIHKLDAVQKEEPELNRIYNKSDAVIVFSNYMKNMLVKDGVLPHKISVVYHSTPLPPIEHTPREQAIIFCGSPIPQVKGFEQFVVALRLLKDNGMALRTKVFGFFHPRELEYAIGKAADQGVDGLLEWQSFTNEGELSAEYQKSLVSIIPYTGYAGYFPSAYSLGHGVPIVATDILGHSEYVGDAGLMVAPGSAEELASALKRVLEDEALRRDLGANGRRRAEKDLRWDEGAVQTHEVYRKAMDDGRLRIADSTRSAI